MGPRRVIFEPLQVDAELYAHGLNRRELREVLDAAHWGRTNRTEYDPPGYAGWNQYSLGNRALRQILIEGRNGEQKWKMSNRGGLCRTISPNDSMAIVVSSGTCETGDPDATPKTRNPKGKESLRELRINRLQLAQIDLFEDGRTDPCLWFLLINIRNGEVFGELSCPIGIGDDGRANEWLTRVILPPDVQDSGDLRRERDDNDPDITIIRRIS